MQFLLPCEYIMYLLSFSLDCKQSHKSEKKLVKITYTDFNCLLIDFNCLLSFFFCSFSLAFIPVVRNTSSSCEGATEKTDCCLILDDKKCAAFPSNSQQHAKNMSYFRVSQHDKNKLQFPRLSIQFRLTLQLECLPTCQKCFKAN